MGFGGYTSEGDSLGIGRKRRDAGGCRMVRRKEIITFFKVGGETLEEEGAFELRVRSHRLRIRGRTSVSSVIFGEDNRVLYV